MARGAAINQLSGMASNPYPRPKEQHSITTFCELCERPIRTLDWSAHKNSKKHRQAEAIERGEVQGINNQFNGDINGFDGDASKPSMGTNGINEFSSNGHNDWGVGDDAGWGGAVQSKNTSNVNNNTGGSGGGDRACFGCGETGHQKRDCPAGSSGGGMTCYGCGEAGHQKRDCPKGGSGGGQACFNCGGTGHRKTECDQPRVMRCRNCDEEGHTSRECGLPTDWSKVKCRNCNNFGHGAARCPDPPAAVSDGDWGNGGGSVAAAVGGWGAAPAEPTGNWADDTTAAVESSGW